jgi:diguanylate cyclase (GGDEF)-like protein
VNRARLVRSGVTDFLTGWHNRRYFQNRLREELARAERTGKPLACLMIDVDNFKEINDRFGHLAGTRRSRKWRGAPRRDSRGRYGRALSAAMNSRSCCPGGEVVHAVKLAERIHQRRGSTPIRVHGGAHVTVTLSIGLATARPTAALARLQGAGGAADRRGRCRAVSREKAGRNRVEDVDACHRLIAVALRYGARALRAAATARETSARLTTP